MTCMIAVTGISSVTLDYPYMLELAVHACALTQPAPRHAQAQAYPLPVTHPCTVLATSSSRRMSMCLTQ